MLTGKGLINTEGLKYLAGYVAHRYRLKYPLLGTTINEDNPVPSTSNMDWIDFLSEGRLVRPSEELLYAAQIVETMFLSFHGSEIQKTPNIIKTLVNLVEEKAKNLISVPHEVLSCLVRTRTYIRIRYSKRRSAKKMKKVCGK